MFNKRYKDTFPQALKAIVVLSFFIASPVFADTDFSGCDYTPEVYTDSISPSALCSSEVDTNRDLYGISVYIHSITDGSGLWTKPDGLTCIPLLNDITTTGYQVLQFGPVSFATTAIPQIQLSDNNSCTGGGPTVTFRGTGATWPYTYQVFHWSTGTFGEGNYETRILSLDPEHSSTTPSGNDVYFRARAYIGEDPTFWDIIDMKLYYNDENHILSELTAFYETELYSGQATTTGIFDFSTTTPLADGNYTVTFSLRNSTLGGIIPNPFGGDNQTVAHQFVVGTSTYLGTVNQNLISDLNTIFDEKNATTTSVLLDHCNLLSGFDITDCMVGLFYPDSESMRSLMEDFKTQIATKAPWGYVTRFFAIISGNSTSTPPVATFSVPDDAYFPASMRNLTITFNPWTVLDDGSILAETTGFGAGSLMDVVMPWFKIVVYGLVVLGLIHKVIGMPDLDPFVSGGEAYPHTGSSGEKTVFYHDYSSGHRKTRAINVKRTPFYRGRKH